MLLGYLICSNSYAANTSKLSDNTALPQIKLRKIELVRLELQPSVGKTEATNIKILIKRLARIDKPDFGLSATLSGDAFSPISSARQFQAGLLTNHRIEDAPDFVELVKLGPRALPFLLDSLDDQTPTKLVINHETGFGGMWFANELRGNPANTNEQKALSWSPKKEKTFSDTIPSYTVKVGDVCFVIIGQIVGRSYQAVRYQPTACIILNSPTHDAMLAKQVRAIWPSTNITQHLLDSLLLDYASEGVFNGRSLDGWGVGNQLQCGAAMRLLYYFPVESTNLIATRLGKLDVGGVGSITNFIERAVVNGVREEDFLKAVAWCEQPTIQTEVRKIFERTDDANILRFSLAAIDSTNPDPYRRRVEDFLRNLPETESGPFGDGYNLLVELGKRFGADAKPAFQRYMQNASLQRLRSMCQVLSQTQGQWSVELLSPLLQDKRPAEGWTYAVIPDQNEPRQSIRICDEAAETITGNFQKLTFKMAGQHKDLDAQIEAMRERIVRNDY